MNENKISKSTLTFGIYASISWLVLTSITFSFAIIAAPPSGPYCIAECMNYPFSELLLYYPRDYIWMHIAVFQVFSYLIFMITNYAIAPVERKLFALLSIGFAIITTTVLSMTYFTQFAVIPISMMKGETDGIALLTQYNGHGLFIALEELGYITMSLSFLFLAYVFPINYVLGKLIRALFIAPSVLMVVFFVYYSLKFGLDRSYRAEVAIISVNWLVTVIGGVLVAYCFNQTIVQEYSTP